MLSGLRNNDLVRSRPTRIRKLSHQATVQKSQSGKSHLDVANQTLRCASFLTEMQFLLPFRISVLITAICLCVQGQTTQSPDAQIEAKGMPPRAMPADYQAQVQAGAVRVAAEFRGHSVPTLQGTLSTDDYVVIETCLFGSPGAPVKLSSDDFSLR